MLATIGIVASQNAFLAAGTFISSYCKETTGNDAAGTYWTGLWQLWNVYADGIGGTYEMFQGDNTMGCYYPNGYIQVATQQSQYVHWFNSFSGAEGYYAYMTAFHYETADGSGGVSIFDTGLQRYYGEIIDSAYDATTGGTYYVAYDGYQGYFEYFSY